MKTNPAKFLALFASAALATTAISHGQLVISSLDTPAVIQFNAGPGGAISGVWGPISTPSGSGFSTTPANLTPCDSDAWSVRVGDSQNYTLPADGTSSTATVGFGGGPQSSGGVARGVNATAGFTAGLGLATSLNNVSGNNGLAFSPSGTGTDNATVWLKIQNTTGQTVSSWDISYLGYYIDIGVYSTPVVFAYSTDNGSTFSSNVSSLGFTTPGTGTVTTPTAADWTQVTGLSSTINATVANNDFLILRWGLGQDIGVNLQPGNRIALDDISISAVPEPSTWALLAVGLTAVTVLRRRRTV